MTERFPDRRNVVSVSFPAKDFSVVANAAVLQGKTVTAFVRAAALGAAAGFVAAVRKRPPFTVTTPDWVTFKRKP